MWYLCSGYLWLRYQWLSPWVLLIQMSVSLNFYQWTTISVRPVIRLVKLKAFQSTTIIFSFETKQMSTSWSLGWHDFSNSCVTLNCKSCSQLITVSLVLPKKPAQTTHFVIAIAIVNFQYARDKVIPFQFVSFGFSSFSCLFFRM